MHISGLRRRARTTAVSPAALPGLLAIVLAAGGCATVPSDLNMAREYYYLGRVRQAASSIEKIPGKETSRVLYLMERGAIHQMQGNYEASARDWNEASDLAEDLDYISLSKSSASLAINDRVLAFRGAPYERTLLHAFAAKSYIAMNLWDDAAVEARIIISALEDLNGFPDDPYSRYLAGVCMQMIGDSEGAALQYRTVAGLLPALGIHPVTGALGIAPRGDAPPPAAGAAGGNSELICFLAIGRGPQEEGAWAGNYRWGARPYAEIVVDGKSLGRSYLFSNTRTLLAATQKRVAVLKTAKTVTRIALKEVASEAVAQKNELLGDLLRLYLFSLEASPPRHWETLPLWLEVARVPCPANLHAFEVVFRNESGAVIKRRAVTRPISCRDGACVSFVRVY